MQDLINALEDLGVMLDSKLPEAQLLRQLKLLNPYSVTTGTNAAGAYATTQRKQLTEQETPSTSYAATELEASLKLLLKQLEAKHFTAYATAYKEQAMAHRQLNP